MLEEKFYSKSGNLNNMSRIGQKPIEIPSNTEVSVSEGVVTVKGPNGTLSKSYKAENIDINIDNGVVTVNPTKDTIFAKALWGTYASHISNMIEGVNKDYEKKLMVEGVGYKAEMKGNTLVLNVGFSHSIEVEIPEGLKVTVEKNEITVAGIDKEQVGQFASKVRAYKKPEPYKGKGIRYSDEVVRRKQGKKTV